MSTLTNGHNELRILFIVPGNPSSGLARIKRIQLFAKGLNELGSSVSIMYSDNAQQYEAERNLHWQRDGKIAFLKIRARTTVSSVFRKIFGSLLDGRAVAEAYERDKNSFRWNCVFIYGQSYQFQRRIVRTCIADGVLCITDLTEWFPNTVRSIASLNHWDQLIFRNWFLAKHSAVVCISTEWLTFAERKGLVPILIPAMSELSEDDSAPTTVPRRLRKENFFTIGYVGVLSDRDLPWLMIDVIETCIKLDLPVRFLVIGNAGSQKTGRKIIRYVNDHPILRNHVVFTGWLELEDMKKQMQNADAFLLLRENNIFSRACFATRLPELLETERTVITTNIGNIDQYLTSYIDAILVSPIDQRTNLVDEIAGLINEPETASRIGASGRQSAIRNFSYRQHSKKLFELLCRLLE